MGKKNSANNNGTGQESSVLTSTPIPTPQPIQDIFSDLDALRISQDYAGSLGVEKMLLTVPLRKPAKEWFVRTHPTLQLQTCILELKDEREIYIPSPGLRPILTTEPTFSPRLLQGAVNRQGTFFVWPLRLPNSNRKIDPWANSALEAAAIAQSQWIRVAANMSLQAYEVFKATGDLSEPTWPEYSFEELLRIAFKNLVIESLDHPVLKGLRGEI